MTAPGCRGADDGAHRWRWQVGRWSGMPSYGCDRCHVIALPMGDDYAEDVAYLTADGRGVMVG